MKLADELSSDVLTHVAAKVQTRVKSWAKTRSRSAPSSPSAQLEWESNVVEYVDFLHSITRIHGNTTNQTTARVVHKSVPIFGPRFIPPTFLHCKKRQEVPVIEPETTYLRALVVIHPFYFPELKICPQCGSDNVKWDLWNGTGARDVHGVCQEERALGY